MFRDTSPHISGNDRYTPAFGHLRDEPRGLQLKCPTCLEFGLRLGVRHHQRHRYCTSGSGASQHVMGVRFSHVEIVT